MPEGSEPAIFALLDVGAAVTPLARARVLVRGKDARSFLHRMSTQHVEGLGAAEARLSALTNKQGRVVDLVHHLTLADDEVALLGTKEDGAANCRWLDGFLFVEKVILEDASAEGGLVHVAGARAPDVVDAGPLERWAMQRDGSRVVVRTFDLVGAAGRPVPAFLVWDRALDDDALARELGARGGRPSSAEELEVARIAAGVPAAPGEIGEHANPLELGLFDAIHWAKGCYIGQEVIARIDNYGKQARQLIGLVVEGEPLAVGDEVTADGLPVGEVTSSARVTAPGRISALALVKLRGDVDGRALAVGGRTVLARRRLAEQAPHD